MAETSLDLVDLRRVNVSRVEAWHSDAVDPWNGADWSNAMCGEAGEAANVVKKLRRIETSVDRGQAEEYGRGELLVDLGKELADIVIYVDLLAQYYGLDLAENVRVKFNEVSDRYGFEERL